MGKLGENGLAIYSDTNKKLYVLTIDNINHKEGLVYFKKTPAYRFIYNKELKLIEVPKSPSIAFRINKLPGFVNKPKKETGQLEIPGFEKKIKKPKGGYPKVFEYTKNLTNISQFKEGDIFDNWICDNYKNYDLSPSKTIEEIIREEIRKVLN